MIIDEETYLSHFGVKGMHWGVRKQRKKLTYKARAERQRKVNKALQIGTGVTGIAAGTAYLVGIFLREHANRSIKTMPMASTDETDFFRRHKGDSMWSEEFPHHSKFAVDMMDLNRRTRFAPPEIRDRLVRGGHPNEPPAYRSLLDWERTTKPAYTYRF